MDTYPLPVPVHVTWVIYPVGHTCALGWYRWYTMSPWGTHSVCGVQHVMHGVTLPVPHTDIPHYGWIPTWVHHPVDTWSWGDTPDPGWIPCCMGYTAYHGCCDITRSRMPNIGITHRYTGWYMILWIPGHGVIPQIQGGYHVTSTCTGCVASHGCTHIPNVRTCNMVLHNTDTDMVLMVCVPPTWGS